MRILSPNVRRTLQLAPLDATPDAERAKGPMDPVLAAVVVGLIGFGVVMVYSASAASATSELHDAQFFLKRQAAYALASLVVLFGISRVDYHRLYKLTYPVLASVAMLLVACVVGFGHSGGGATRWLSIGPVHVQPAEMAKLAIVVWLAYSLAKKAERVKTFTVGFLPHVLMAGVFMVLCLKQPDFGSAVVLLFLTFTMLFVAGAKLGYILGVSIVGAAFGAFAIRYSVYRYARYLAWMHMDEHRQDLAYQPFQSVMSFGAGGPSGVGGGGGPPHHQQPPGPQPLRRGHRRRGARFRRRAPLEWSLLAARAARRAGCPPRTRRLRRLSGVRDRHDVRRSGAAQPGCRAVALADQGPHAPVRQLRGLVAARERGGGGNRAEHFAPR
jgi:hypothetical protein